MRTIQELEIRYLNDDAAVEEFDSIIASFRRRRIVAWSAACAASIALSFSLITLDFSNKETLPSTIEVMETIAALTENNLDEIDCINANPGRNGIVVTAEFKNGETRTYLMTKSGDSIEMTAQNINNKKARK